MGNYKSSPLENELFPRETTEEPSRYSDIFVDFNMEHTVDAGEDGCLHIRNLSIKDEGTLIVTAKYLVIHGKVVLSNGLLEVVRPGEKGIGTIKLAGGNRVYMFGNNGIRGNWVVKT